MVDKSFDHFGIYLCTVDPVLAAIDSVMDQNHVDLSIPLEVDLPPVVSVMPAVGAASCAISSVDVTVNSSLRHTTPSNRALFSGSSL